MKALTLILLCLLGFTRTQAQCTGTPTDTSYVSCQEYYDHNSNPIFYGQGLDLEYVDIRCQYLHFMFYRPCIPVIKIFKIQGREFIEVFRYEITYSAGNEYHQYSSKSHYIYMGYLQYEEGDRYVIQVKTRPSKSDYFLFDGSRYIKIIR